MYMILQKQNKKEHIFTCSMIKKTNQLQTKHFQQQTT